MNRTTWRRLALGLWLAAALRAQQTSGGMGGGGFGGPNVLSRWSRLPGNAPSGPMLQAYLHGSYAYLGGLVGPVDGAGNPTTPASRDPLTSGSGAHSAVGGGGLSLNRTDSRSTLSLNYSGNYTGTYARNADAYRGLNQFANLMYERTLTRRWGFYTGHSAGSQSSILGLSRSSAQRNFFDPAFSPSNEALDARLRSISSGAGFYFKKSSKLTGSLDGGFFTVSRQSSALVSSRGERAQGELSYRLDRNQSIGALYSFSHFYFPRGFGETYVQSVMMSYTRRLNRYWNMQFAAGPYQADSERLRTVAVDPYIAALTGNASTIEVFRGISRGIGVNASLGANFRQQNFHASYRRSVDSGNGVTLSAVSNSAQASYGYQTTRNLGISGSLFYSSLQPLLTGLERNADFKSYGSMFNVSYRLTSYLHLIGNAGLHHISYADLRIDQFRFVSMVGLAYSPSALPIMR